MVTSILEAFFFTNIHLPFTFPSEMLADAARTGDWDGILGGRGLPRLAGDAAVEDVQRAVQVGIRMCPCVYRYVRVYLVFT